MENFTPVSALVGGCLIGLAATLLLWFNGRIAGISGILNATINPTESERGWRLLFLLGIVIGAGVYVWAIPAALPAFTGMPNWVVAGAGLLVGIGTRMGSGCTSGHGICGIGRLSMRSLIATVIFLVTGMMTVFVVRHLSAAVA